MYMYRTVYTASRVLVSSTALVSLDIRSFEAYETGQGRNSHPSEDLQGRSSGMRFRVPRGFSHGVVVTRVLCVCILA